MQLGGDAAQAGGAEVDLEALGGDADLFDQQVEQPLLFSREQAVPDGIEAGEGVDNLALVGRVGLASGSQGAGGRGGTQR